MDRTVTLKVESVTLGVFMDEYTMEGAGDSAFNSGLEYLRTLTTIERNIDYYMIEEDWKRVHNNLEQLWMKLESWMDNPKDKKVSAYGKDFKCQKDFHSFIRQIEVQNHKKMLIALRQGKQTIPTDIIEAYKLRYLWLQRFMHEKKLRMPHKDDPAMAISGKAY